MKQYAVKHKKKEKVFVIEAENLEELKKMLDDEYEVVEEGK